MLHCFALRQQVQVKNPYLDSMEEDILYHFSLGTKTHNLPEMFGDIKVCELWQEIKLVLCLVFQNLVNIEVTPVSLICLP